MKELNLVEILKDCPKGTKFYTPICGEVEFVKVTKNSSIFPIITRDINGIKQVFTKKGYYIDWGTPECILFPSKDQRDWNVWKEEQDKKTQENTFKVGDHAINTGNDIVVINKITDSDLGWVKMIDSKFGGYSQDLSNLNKIDKYPIERFKPFDRVLVRYHKTGTWHPNHYGFNNENSYGCIGGLAIQCVPYNEETKHLIGTTATAPEFYRTWEGE